MTREEIDAIYDAKQNISPVNNTGITRAEIDAIFDGVANANNAQNMKSIQPTNASVSSPVTEGQDIVDMNGNVTKAKVNTTNSKQKPSFISKEEQQRRIADAQAIKDKKKQAEFARNNFQKTNEVISGIGIPKGMTKDDVEIQKLYNEMNSTKNPNIKRNLQRTIDEKERVANQTLVSDNADEKEISSALEKWASPGYKMTSEEKKNARKLFGNGFKEGIDMNILSDEDKNNLAVAYSKSNPIQNFMAGFADNPAFKTFSNIYTKYADVTEDERASLEASDELTRRMIENAYTQQPIVTSGGKLAGSMAEYAIGSKVIGALPGVGTATNKAGQAIGKGAEKALGTLGIGMTDAGSKGVANIGTKLLSGGAQRAGQAIGNSASNIIGDSLVDVALDTVPNALNDAKSGANGKEVGINAAKNLAANIGFNAVGEAAQVIPYLGMNMKNYGRNDKAYSEAMDNIANRNPLKPLENMDNTMKQNPINAVADYDVKDEGKVLVENKEKVNTILNRNGLQLPNRISGDDSFFNNSISNSAEKVNTPITDYKKVKINNHDDFNSQIDKYVGMYGDDAAKQKAVEVKEAMNKVLADNSDEAWEDAIKKTQELDNMLQGKSYTYKRKNGKNRNYQQQSTYSGEIASAFNTDAESIASEALENASKNTEKVKYMAEDTGLRKTSVQNGSTVDYYPAKSGLSDSMNDSVSLENNSTSLTSGEFKRRGYTDETIQKTDMPEEIKNEFRDNPRAYEVLKNKDTQSAADSIIANNDFNGAYSQFKTLLAKKDPTAIPLGYSLSKQLAQSGNTEQAIDIIDSMSEQLTKSGQFSQSAAITMLHNDPMASMRYMERQIDKMNTAGRQRYKNWKDFELTDDEVKAFANIDAGDKEKIQELYGQITDRLAKSYPSTKWEKIVEASKTAMMLSPRTHIRNTAANAVMLPVRSLSDRVSALGQNAIHLFNPDFKVTQSLTGGTFSQKKIANQIFDEQIKPLLEDANKWSDVAKNAPNNRQVFNDSFVGKIGKKATMAPINLVNSLTGGKINNLVERVDKSMTNSVMENLRKFDYWLLGEVEDNPFVKANFSNRLASYMKAQGINTIDDVPNEAVQIAYQEALKATFKDDNTLTKMFSNLKRDTGKFGEVMLPFTKTPANIAMRGIDYSPVGIVNAVKQSKSGADASQVIDTLSKSATGTAGIYIGYKLAENGLIQGALSDDKDKQQFEKQQGKVAFSLNIGGHYYSFDWAQPAAIPIIIGSTIYDSINESDKEISSVVNTVWQGATAATNAWADLSPLSSLQDILGGDGYGNNSIAENVFNEVAEFPQRLVPAVLGATARTIDPTIRQTYSNDNTLQTQIDTLKSKIPFLSKTLPASYDTWGNERKRQDSTGNAAIANFLNPGTLGYNASTPLDSEITRLFDATQDNTVFPQKADWSVKDASGNKINLTNRQYSEYQKTMGQTSYDIADALINSDFYSGLSDSDKAKYLSDIYSVAKGKAKKDLFGSSTSDSIANQIAIYEEGGAEGLVQEMQTKYEITSKGLTVSDKTRQIYEEGGAQALDEYASYKGSVEQSGLTVSDKTQNIYDSFGNEGLELYSAAKTKLGDSISGSNLIPFLQDYSLSDSQKGEYISQFTKISDKAQAFADNGEYEKVYQYYNIKSNADSDGNGSLKKQELIDYLDGTGMSTAEKRTWFSILSTAKNPY